MERIVRNDVGLEHIWTGAVRVDVGAAGASTGMEPPVAACCAIPWSMDEAAEGGGCLGAAPGAARLYMLSIVGRSAAPKGVLRKSVGKSFEASDGQYHEI